MLPVTRLAIVAPEAGSWLSPTQEVEQPESVQALMLWVLKLPASVPSVKVMLMVVALRGEDSVIVMPEGATGWEGAVRGVRAELAGREVFEAISTDWTHA